MQASNKPEVVKRFDNPAPLFPGEHWVDLVGGVAAWVVTRKHPSLAVRTLGVFIGAGHQRRARPPHHEQRDALDADRRRHQARSGRRGLKVRRGRRARALPRIGR